jgi:hypothetical protein
MATEHDDTRRPYLREGLLLLGFVLLLAAATLSVVVPELSREPDTAASGSAKQATPADAQRAAPSK